MLLIPDKTAAHLKGRVTHPSIIITHSTLNKNVDYTLDYIRTSSNFVDADHFILQILDSIPMNREASLLELTFMMKTVANRLAPSLGLVHHNSVGKPKEGNIFVNDAEYYLVVETDPVEESWEDVEPLKFLYHEHTEIGYHFDIASIDTSLCLVSIDLAKLAWQYMRWRESDRLDGTETKAEFVYKYVLGNMLRSYNDIAFFNRHLFAVEGTASVGTKIRTDVKLIDNDAKIDRLVIENIKQNSKRALTVPMALGQIQPPHSDSILDALFEIDVPNTLQTHWLLMLRELPFLRYGLHAAGKRGDINARYKSTLRRELLAMQKTRIWDKLPKQHSLHIIENYFYKTLELLED